MKLEAIFSTAAKWFSETPERALDRAYKTTLKIKNIEDKYFDSKKVCQKNTNYSQSVINYFGNEINGYLKSIDAALVEFKASRFFMNLTDLETYRLKSKQPQDSDGKESEKISLILEKLKLIDEVTGKYKISEKQNGKVKNTGAITPITQSLEAAASKGKSADNRNSKRFQGKAKENLAVNSENQSLPKKATEKTGVLPRSFLTTINRIRREIDPKSSETEKDVLQKFRTSRYKTAASIKFLLLLIIVPLLTHQLTKNLLLSPVVERYFHQNSQVVFINHDLQEEALIELRRFEETLDFKSLIGLTPKLTPEEKEEKVKEKALEISQEFRHQGADAIANIFADIASLAAFAIVIVMNRQDLEKVKSFLDEIFYTLSDSAKAFLIILFTDMFVGFHSPHGWEVILSGISRHFGLPENQEFNFLFIATFPVILDTILKYWIFRYLNRISPSAVATYRNMNE